MTTPRYPVTVSRERMRQLRRNAAGKCSVAGCDRDLAKNRGGKCATHGKSHSESRLQYYYAHRASTTKVQRCTACHKAGHNSRRCPEAKS